MRTRLRELRVKLDLLDHLSLDQDLQERTEKVSKGSRGRAVTRRRGRKEKRKLETHSLVPLREITVLLDSNSQLSSSLDPRLLLPLPVGKGSLRGSVRRTNESKARSKVSSRTLSSFPSPPFSSFPLPSQNSPSALISLSSSRRRRLLLHLRLLLRSFSRLHRSEIDFGDLLSEGVNEFGELGSRKEDGGSGGGRVNGVEGGSVGGCEGSVEDGLDSGEESGGEEEGGDWEGEKSKRKPNEKRRGRKGRRFSLLI